MFASQNQWKNQTLSIISEYYDWFEAKRKPMSTARYTCSISFRNSESSQRIIGGHIMVQQIMK